MESDAELVSALRDCRACEGKLPFPPRPIFQFGAGAPILIASQAPGIRAHESGQPFDDRSGDRLRDWLGVSRAEFYDPANFSIIPMGLCYPGRGASGDAPPRPECAPIWRARIERRLGAVRLVLLVGSYAQDHYLGRGRMSDRVRDFRAFLPGFLPLPHPSWRTTGWMRRNPWFEVEVLPELRRRTGLLLGGDLGPDAGPPVFAAPAPDPAPDPARAGRGSARPGRLTEPGAGPRGPAA